MNYFYENLVIRPAIHDSVVDGQDKDEGPSPIDFLNHDHISAPHALLSEPKSGANPSSHAGVTYGELSLERMLVRGFRAGLQQGIHASALLLGRNRVSLVRADTL
jgi:hypothetical protein